MVEDAVLQVLEDLREVNAQEKWDRLDVPRIGRVEELPVCVMSPKQTPNFCS